MTSALAPPGYPQVPREGRACLHPGTPGPLRPLYVPAPAPQGFLLPQTLSQRVLPWLLPWVGRGSDPTRGKGSHGLAAFLLLF